MGETPSNDRIETRRRTLLAAAAGGLSVGALGGTPGTAAAQDGDTLTIVHDTHFHGRFEDASDAEKSLARYYVEAARLREEYGNSAFIGNGDDLAPSLLGLEYEGAHMIEALNYMEPDAVGAGNHEFDFGLDVAEQRFADSEFPWTVANLRTPDGDAIPGTDRWLTINPGSATIGVFGLVVNGFHSITSYPEDHEVIDNVEAAQEATTALKENMGADFVVCAAHISTGQQERVAEAVDELDAIVGSHSGVAFAEPKVVNDTVISEFGDEFDHLGRLTFDMESGELTDWERVDFYNSEALGDDESPPEETENYTPVDVQSVEPDQELASLSEEYLGELEERLGEPIVESEVELNATFDNYAIETGWGNLMTDLARNVGDLDREIDVATQNAGGIRSGSTYGPGPITGLDVMDILPFPNEIEVYELSGAQLYEYLEGEVRPLPSQYGAQPAIQVSGVSYEWTGHHEEGEIDNLFVGGEPVDEEATYLVATNDYVAGNSVIGDGELVLQSGQFQGPFTIDQLEELDTVAPEREHRMIRVDEDLGDAEVSVDGDTTTVTLPNTEASEGVVEGTYRAVSRTGAVVQAEGVSETEDAVEVTFAADALADLATSVEDPVVRVFGEFEPNDEHYGYESDGETVDLPNSSGYDAFKLKGRIDADAAAQTGGEETEEPTDEPATDAETEDGSGEGTDAGGETGDSAPGFGVGAGAAGVAGGAYLYDRLSGDDAADESE